MHARRGPRPSKSHGGAPEAANAPRPNQAPATRDAPKRGDQTAALSQLGDLLGEVDAAKEETQDNGPYKGLSAFALMNKDFPVKDYLKIMKDVARPILPVLWGTFGTDVGNLKEAMASFEGRDNCLEIHISNEAGRRNGRLGEGELLKGVTDTRKYDQMLKSGDPKLKAAVQGRVRRIAKQLGVMRDSAPGDRVVHDNTELLLSTGLESQFSDTGSANIQVWMREAWEAVSDFPMGVVHSPVGQGPENGGKHLELHGENPDFGNRESRGIGNLDGISVDVGDGERYKDQISVDEARAYLDRYSDAFATILWSARQQGLDGGGLGVPVPPPRGRKFVISKKAIKAFSKLLADA